MAQAFYAKLARAVGTGTTPAQVQKVMEKLFDMTVDTVSNGDSLKIPNYCTVKLHKRCARPEHVRKVFGKAVTVAARDVSASVKILPVKKLKEHVQDKALK